MHINLLGALIVSFCLWGVAALTSALGDDVQGYDIVQTYTCPASHAEWDKDDDEAYVECEGNYADLSKETMFEVAKAFQKHSTDKVMFSCERRKGRVSRWKTLHCDVQQPED